MPPRLPMTTLSATMVSSSSRRSRCSSPRAPTGRQRAPSGRGGRKLIAAAPRVKSDQLAHGDGGVAHAVREAPLVVVPGDNADKGAGDHLGLVEGDDRRARIVVEV